MILLVDDEIFSLEMMSRRLRQAGYLVLEASSVQEAKLACEKLEGITAVVADIHMPGECGLQLLRWLSVEWPDIRRLVLSAHIYEKELMEELENGLAHAVIAKPVSTECLLDQLKKQMLQ